MKSLNFKTTIFMLLLMTSTLIAFSTQMWFQVWMTLEINLMMFIPLIINNNLSMNSSMKYFIIQSLSSSLFLFFLMMNQNFYINNIISMMIMTAMSLKLGISPLHFWLPQISEGLSWMNFTMLMTWQKLIPFFILSNIKMLMLKMMLILSILFSTMGILNQISIRKLLVFSSISHMSWILIMLNNNYFNWMIYFFLYSMIILSFYFLFKYFNISSLNQTLIMFNKIQKMLMMIFLFSLSGLPPFLGFYMKWMIIYKLYTMNIMILIMIMSSFIMIFIYLQIIFSIYFSMNMNYIWNKMLNAKFNFMYNLLLLFIMIPIMI